MKLLILLIITLSLNFSLLNKNTQMSNQLSTNSMIEIIEQKSTELYIQGKQLVNLIKNDLLFKIDEYNQFIQVAILGKPVRKEFKFAQKKNNFLLSSGNSQINTTKGLAKKNYPCYL